MNTKIDKRTKNRIDIMFLLFENEFQPLSLDDARNEEEIFSKAFTVINKYEEIDNIISLNLENYKINRLNKVDLCIIRYATYELLYTDTPAQIIINEAINITKIYSNAKNTEYKFNNKLLDKIKEYIKNVEETNKKEE